MLRQKSPRSQSEYSPSEVRSSRKARVLASPLKRLDLSKLLVLRNRGFAYPTPIVPTRNNVGGSTSLALQYKPNHFDCTAMMSPQV